MYLIYTSSALFFIISVSCFSFLKALAARDSMAKALYGALFDWIVDKVRMYVHHVHICVCTCISQWLLWGV